LTAARTDTSVRKRRLWPWFVLLPVFALGLWLRGPIASQAALRNHEPAIRDVAYGPHPAQRFDVYLPRETKNAPMVFFVHGGAWRFGDKAAGVGEKKVVRWTAAGAIVVSANYRMLPDADPLEQARDVARAVAAAQAQATKLGGDPNALVLMGHSAGAHLVAMLASSPELAREAGVAPWRGNVLLDGGAIDAESTMRARGDRKLFKDAFGEDPAYWRAASPMARLNGKIAPTLAVCSQQRRDSCDNNRAFVDKAREFGTNARLLAKPLSHMEINRDLGGDNAYTREVEAFFREIGLRLKF
jgi:acetyl esterase/lipase